jgi:hypothetical protein
MQENVMALGWSRAWLYNTLGLFNDYKIRYYQA